MRILQVNTADIGGGAESVAWQMLKEYRDAGHSSWLAVGCKQSEDPDVFLIPQNEFRHPWVRLWLRLAEGLGPRVGSVGGGDRILKLCGLGIGQPNRLCNRIWGIEDFSFPGTRHLADLTPASPEILQCHNMHGAWLPDGGYFDLMALPWLSQRVPVVATLHDAWLLSGHCAHSFECERWKTGCGSCPDLTIYPAIKRDATAYNWRRKQRIFGESRLYVSTPSHWLLGKVQQSMLAPAIVESRVIPNGVNLAVFHPADKRTVREELGISQRTKVVLFAAHGVRKNVWKDYSTMRGAIQEVGRRMQGEAILFVALGEGGEAEQVGHAQIRFVPFIKDPEAVARYYQAADVYLHAARADTFPNTVLEAVACGTPVVATAVGGISEQVDEGGTGFLVSAGDVEGLANRVIQLLSDENLQKQLSQEAVRVARERYDIRDQARAYLNWFEEIIKPSTPQAATVANVGAGLTEIRV